MVEHRCWLCKGTNRYVFGQQSQTPERSHWHLLLLNFVNFFDSPVILPWLCPLASIACPSSRRHRIAGSGYPLASHVRFTLSFSRTTKSLVLRLSMIEGGTWTSMYPLLLLIGSVLTWHMYQPLSTSCTFDMWSFHSLCSRWESETLWFLVMMLLCMVRIVCVSTRTQATWITYFILVNILIAFSTFSTTY